MPLLQGQEGEGEGERDRENYTEQRNTEGGREVLQFTQLSAEPSSQAQAVIPDY